MEITRNFERSSLALLLNLGKGQGKGSQNAATLSINYYTN